MKKEVDFTKKRKCSGCGKKKEFSEYYKDKSRRGGHDYYCKKCRDEIYMEYYKKNRDKILPKMRDNTRKMLRSKKASS